MHRTLDPEDVGKIVATYHAWRGDEGVQEYEDVPGFCKAATIEEIRSHGFVLTPGRYVGVMAADEDDVPFEEKCAALKARLEEHFAEADELTATIRARLAEISVNA